MVANKFKICLFLLSIGLSLQLNISYGQINSKEIDRLVENAMQKFSVAGVAVGIVKDGKIIHNKGYGVKSIKTKEKVNQHTNFHIASNSKAFTTTALAILVEDGIINWQDKVKDHLPEFKMYNAYVTENFNIQDLVTHRSGLGLGIGDLMYFPDSTDFTMKDLMNVCQYFTPTSAFRTQFDYDNLLYFIAGEIIARKSEMTWEAFVDKRIFKPLGMDNSYGNYPLMKDKKNLALPHSTGKGQIRIIKTFEQMLNGAPGGILSNVDDLCNWMLVHLNKGKYGKNLENRLFTEQSQREMWKIHTPLNANPDPRYNSHFNGYGLGWFLSDQKGQFVVTHTGGLPGMLSKTLLLPDLGLGIVVLTNTESGGGALFTAVTQSIMDSYLELDPIDWVEYYLKRTQKRHSSSDSIVAKVWETVKNADSKQIDPSNYVGIYKSDWFGKVEVFLKEKQLWIKCHKSPKLIGPMQFYKANTFAIKWEFQDMNADAFAMFGLNEDGKAVRIKMKGISPDIDFSYDFEDLDLRRVKE